MVLLYLWPAGTLRYDLGEVHPKWLVLAALFCGLARGQAPSYSAAGIANASNYAPGPFAPNSVVSIFGTNLAWSPATGDAASGKLPVRLNGVEVRVDSMPAPLLYVAEKQINFIVPSNEINGDVTVQVVRQGVAGPLVTITLVDTAPALFDTGSGYAIAQHGADYSLLTPDSPAHAGEVIVIYATGLGKTQPNPNPGEVPQTQARIVNLSALTIYLDGTAVDPSRIWYAGVSPKFFVGLYQINLWLPGDIGTDPEIRLSIGSQSTPVGLKLAVRDGR